MAVRLSPEYARLVHVSAPVFLVVATGLGFVASCAGKRPFELSRSLEIPRHECARSGIEACELACDEQSDGHACLVASVAHGEGHGGPVNDAAMRELELRACQLGQAQGCEHYANNFSSSKDKGELALARKHFELACEGGRASSCARAGFIALRLDATGQPGDAPAAFDLYDRACQDEVAWACASVGDMLTFGIGTPKDAERAAASYRKACAGDDEDGCHNVEDPSEHWITGPTAMVLLERLHAPDPSIAFGDVSSDWRTRVAARICFAQGGTEPVAVRLNDSADLATTKIKKTLQEWRFQARPGWTLERPVCLKYRFDLSMEIE